MSVDIRQGDALAVLRTLPSVTNPLSGGRFKPGEHWRKPKPHWSRDWLHREYVEHGRSTSEIGAEMGCSEANICYWLKRHGIPARSMSEIRAAKRWGSHGAENPMFGRTGPLNPRYVDGSSPERQRLYVQARGKAFLREILKRDGYRCRRCSAPNRLKKRGLHVHHIKPWAGHQELRFSPENTVTLCRDCHNFVHSNSNVHREYLP